MTQSGPLSGVFLFLAILLCLLVIAGWHFDIVALQSLWPGAPPTTPLTALIILALALSLWLANRYVATGRPAFGAASAFAAALVACIALYTAAEYLLDFDSRLNVLLYAGKVSAIGGRYPGRPSPQTAAAAFVTAGAIGLSWLSAPAIRRVVAVLLLLALTIVWLVLFGYASTTNPFYAMPGNPETGMSPITVLGFSLLLAGTVTQRPADGLAGVVTAKSSGGRLIRRLLPVVALTPLVLGWIAASGSARGLFDPSFGFALNWGLASLVFAALIVWQGYTLHRHDIERQEVAAEREEILRNLEQANTRIRGQAVELERSNEELKQFAYVASHDLQAPLRGVGGFAQLLKEEYSDKLEGTASEWLDRIIQSADRMQMLIRDLLEYSRVESRGAAFDRVDLQEVFTDAAGLLQPLIAESNAKVNAENLPVVAGSKIQLTQLFQNLIGNALKYCEEEPEVTVSCAASAGRWEIAFRDNGIGIDEKYHRKIFEIFGRLHHESDYSGTGIGLALCRRITERHGGSIRVESTPGNGSTFCVSLPVQAPDNA